MPDIEAYVHALRERLMGQPLQRVRVRNPFVLRSVAPQPQALHGLQFRSVERLGKRVVLGLEHEHFVVMHLMIAGRFRWLPGDKQPPGKLGLAAFDVEHGSLWLTEAGSKRRASMHVVAGAASLAEFDRGGLEPLEAAPAQFAERLRASNHTLKRALTDPRIMSGIGNAYSDEILHRAKLSPLLRTRSLTNETMVQLYAAMQSTLREWCDRLLAEAAREFPGKVTAFRDEMAVHGKYGHPCPVCGAPVQRIRYADNETNYCARCQTGGRRLSDRALARLLGDDWPRDIDAPL